MHSRHHRLSSFPYPYRTANWFSIIVHSTRYKTIPCDRQPARMLHRLLKLVVTNNVQQAPTSLLWGEQKTRKSRVCGTTEQSIIAAYPSCPRHRDRQTVDTETVTKPSGVCLSGNNFHRPSSLLIVVPFVRLFVARAPNECHTVDRRSSSRE